MENFIFFVNEILQKYENERKYEKFPTIKKTFSSYIAYVAEFMEIKSFNYFPYDVIYKFRHEDGNGK